jgi:hypothetical protein
MTLHSPGLIFGDPATLGTTTFQVTVTDAAGNTATDTFLPPYHELTRAGPAGLCDVPDPDPRGAQRAGDQRQDPPSGTATANEANDSGCGGYSLLTVQVKNVNLANGTVLWVTLDGLSVGEITLNRGSGTMPTYNMGNFSVNKDLVRVCDSLPDASPFQQILIGGGFS